MGTGRRRWRAGRSGQLSALSYQPPGFSQVLPAHAKFSQLIRRLIKVGDHGRRGLDCEPIKLRTFPLQCSQVYPSQTSDTGYRYHPKRQPAAPSDPPASSPILSAGCGRNAGVVSCLLGRVGGGVVPLRSSCECGRRAVGRKAVEVGRRGLRMADGWHGSVLRWRMKKESLLRTESMRGRLRRPRRVNGW